MGSNFSSFKQFRLFIVQSFWQMSERLLAGLKAVHSVLQLEFKTIFMISNELLLGWRILSIVLSLFYLISERRGGGA